MGATLLLQLVIALMLITYRIQYMIPVHRFIRNILVILHYIVILHLKILIHDVFQLLIHNKKFFFHFIRIVFLEFFIKFTNFQTLKMYLN